LARLAVLIQVGFWLVSLMIWGLERYRDREMEKDDAGVATAVGALAFLGRVVIWTLVLLTGLSMLGFDIGPALAGFGLGGIAVALAVQNILGDLFASLSIIFDRPFVVGDFIVVGSEAGTVEHVGLKTTRVRSLSGEQLVFSNSDLLASRVRNFKRMSERRILFRFGVEYGSGIDQLRAIPGIVREIIDEIENIRFDRAHFASFGDSSLDFEVVYYITLADYNAYMDAQQTINFELYRRLEELGVGFAFPTRTVHLIASND
jgi:small-conductance mechanosensitive channel